MQQKFEQLAKRINGETPLDTPPVVVIWNLATGVAVSERERTTPTGRPLWWSLQQLAWAKVAHARLGADSAAGSLLVDDLVHKVSVCSGTAVQQQQRAAAGSVLVCGRPVLVQLDGDATGSGGARRHVELLDGRDGILVKAEIGGRKKRARS
jgi:hypothetical protein